jgi:hypothetical protein
MVITQPLSITASIIIQQPQRALRTTDKLSFILRYLQKFSKIYMQIAGLRISHDRYLGCAAISGGKLAP